MYSTYSLKGPESMLLGLNWRLGPRRDCIFSSFDGSVEVWSESVLLALKLLFGSTDHTFSSNSTGKKFANPQVVGQYENAVIPKNAGAAKKDLTLLKPEAPHLTNTKNKDAICTWKGLANTPKAQTSGQEGLLFEVVCGVFALGCGDVVLSVRETLSSSSPKQASPHPSSSFRREATWLFWRYC